MESKIITNNKIENITVDVIPLAPVDNLYTYLLDTSTIAGSTVESIVGCRVLIPFSNRKIVGVVSQEHKGEINFDSKKLKKVIKILDDKPIISQKMFELCKWVSEYYVANLGEVLKSFIPEGLKKVENTYVEFLGVQKFGKELLSNQEKRIIEYLSKRKAPTSLNNLQRVLRIKNILEILQMLQEKELIRFRKRIGGIIPKKTVITIDKQIFSSEEKFGDILAIIKRKRNLVAILEFLYEQIKKGIECIDLDVIKKEFSKVNVKKYLRELEEINLIEIKQIEDKKLRYEYHKNYNFPNELLLPLNEQQEKAFLSISEAIERSTYKSFLLYGVTGSGKTLIYLHSLRRCLEKNKSAIILVPEISLTPQLIERFDNAFPDQIAVLHSRLSSSERLRQWLSILNGDKRIVIGARSAIFAPARNLGLIVVDEEHEPSYKQEDQTPRYNARDLALVRGRIENSVVILGTATPSINTFYAATQGKHTILKIDKRADGAKLPEVILIDMLEKRARRKTYGQFSDTLIHKIIERISKKEGVILFQNRRGFGLLLECRYCGYIPKCPECEVSLTFHKSEQKLKCHYCGYKKTYEPTCPKCGKAPMIILGYGTQRIEEELCKILEEFNHYPRIERFDLDVVLKNPQKNQILQKFYSGEIDILVGTQLIAKGIDFERVTLVGIINADLQLNVPDFCANERAFQLFTQVAGRAGRRSLFPGEVIIQTTNPENYAIESFVKNEFLSFFNREIHYRKTLQYPPFFRLVSLEIQYKFEDSIDEVLFSLKDKIQEIKNAIVLGPVTPIIPKIRGWNRKVFLLKIYRQKDPSSKYTSKMLKALNQDFAKKYTTKNVKLHIDVDAQFSLL